MRRAALGRADLGRADLGRADLGRGCIGAGVGLCMEVGREGAGRDELGKVARLPEQEKVFQPAEDAGEAGHDEGVQGSGQPSAIIV